MHRMTALVAIACTAILPGCNTIDAPLIFGKVNTLGITASATAPDQGGTVTLGYRSANISVVPVTARDAYGNPIVLKERRGDGNDGAFSTFAHFEASAAAVPGAK